MSKSGASTEQKPNPTTANPNPTKSNEAEANPNPTKSNEAEEPLLVTCEDYPIPRRKKIIQSLSGIIRSRPWYHGFMTRSEAEIICSKDGQWLVRVAQVDRNSEVGF